MFDGHDGPVRPQDFRVVYRTLASSPEGVSALIEFLTGKLDRIVNEVINGEQVAASVYSLLASRVALDEEILKVNVVMGFVSFFVTRFTDRFVRRSPDRRPEEEPVRASAPPKQIQLVVFRGGRQFGLVPRVPFRNRRMVESHCRRTGVGSGSARWRHYRIPGDDSGDDFDRVAVVVQRFGKRSDFLRVYSADRNVVDAVDRRVRRAVKGNLLSRDRIHTFRMYNTRACYDGVCFKTGIFVILCVSPLQI